MAAELELVAGGEEEGGPADDHPHPLHHHHQLPPLTLSPFGWNFSLTVSKSVEQYDTHYTVFFKNHLEFNVL